MMDEATGRELEAIREYAAALFAEPSPANVGYPQRELLPMIERLSAICDERGVHEAVVRDPVLWRFTMVVTGAGTALVQGIAARRTETRPARL